MNCENALSVTLCTGSKGCSDSSGGNGGNGGSGNCGGNGNGGNGDHSCNHPTITLTDAINLDRSDIAASAKAVKTAVAKAKTELDVHIADVNAHGGSGGSGSDIDISQFFNFGDINFFNRKTPPQGYVVANGSLIEHADTLYPEMWAFLQEADNAWRVKTEAEWQALIHEDGMGGANAFVLDAVAKTMRLPDMRGDYFAGAGWNEKAVGDCDGDAIRNITGSIVDILGSKVSTGSGAHALGRYGQKHIQEAAGWWMHANTTFDASRVVPTDIRNHPATIYMLPCVYIGKACNSITQTKMKVSNMQTAYSFDKKGFFVGTDSDYGTGLPNNATYVLPPTLQKGFIPHWSGSAWTQSETHIGETGYVNGKSFEIKEHGAYPNGWSSEAPEPTAEEIKEKRIAEINQELDAIDRKSISLERALRVGRGTDADTQKLLDLDNQAIALTEELQGLST